MSHRDAWLPCATCDGTGVVYAAGPDYFGNYDSDDCPTCSGTGAIGPDRFVAVCADGMTHGAQADVSRQEAGALAARLDSLPRRDCSPHRAAESSGGTSDRVPSL